MYIPLETGEIIYFPKENISGSQLHWPNGQIVYGGYEIESHCYSYKYFTIGETKTFTPTDRFKIIKIQNGVIVRVYAKHIENEIPIVFHTLKPGIGVEKLKRLKPEYFPQFMYFFD